MGDLNVDSRLLGLACGPGCYSHLGNKLEMKALSLSLNSVVQIRPKHQCSLTWQGFANMYNGSLFTMFAHSKLLCS